MKKFVAGTLLFFAGLLLLRELERRSDWAPETAESAVPVTLPEGAGGDSATAGVSVRGRFQADLYNPDDDSVAISVRSADSRTEDGADHLVDVDLFVFGSHRGEKIERAKIHAARALLPREPGAGIEPRYEKRLHLEEVHGTLEDLFRGSTLEIDTPNAAVDFSDPGHAVLGSEQDIAISSAAFDAGGKGFQLDIVRPDEGGEVAPPGNDRVDVIELARNGWMEFRPEEGLVEGETPLRSGRIEATGDGELQIRRSGDTDPHPIAFEVWKGGRLELLGRDTWVLSGMHLILEGESLESARSIRARRVTVDGDASWTSGKSVFTGENGEIDFDDQGLFRRAIVEGLARARIKTSFSTGESPEDVSSETTLDIRSDGEIEVTRAGDETSYRVAGPATVETRGIRIRSNGDLTGTRTEAEGSKPLRPAGSRNEKLSLHGTGGVRVEAANGSLETAEFDLFNSFTEEGKPITRGTASGGARLVGTDAESGRTFTVTSPHSLEVERIGEELRLVEGTNVEISVADAETKDEIFFARCDKLTDLSIADQTFLAEGQVLYRRGENEATCARLEALDAERFRMWGDERQRAEFRSPLGEAQADLVEVNGGRVHAHGNVAASITSVPEELDLDRYRLFCEDLVAYRIVEDLEDGTFLRRLVLDAAGEVRSRVESSGRIVDLTHAEAMHAVREDQLGAFGTEDERRIGSFTELVARGAVDAEIFLYRDANQTAKSSDTASKGSPIGSGMRVRSEVLKLRRDVIEEGASEPDVSVVASGNVHFEGLGDVNFQGEGDRLRVDPDRSGHLDPVLDGRVKLFGILPTHGLPFELVATHVDFDEARIDADDPDLVVSNEAPEVEVDEAPEPEIVYRAQARRLVATRSSVDLLGDVVLDGRTQKGVPWTMEAKRIALQGSKGADKERPAELSKISANGGIVFRLGRICTARAESLHGVRLSGVLRLAGSPAVVDFLGRREEAEWMDFDPELGIILEAGRGTTYGESKKKAAKEKGSGGSSPSNPGGSGGQSGAGLGTVAPPPPPQEVPQDRWSLEKLWLTTRVDQDSFVICVQEPVFRYPEHGTTLRASWAILWIDREKLEQLTSGEKQSLNEQARRRFEAAPLGPMRVFFDLLEERGVSGLVQEAYFEGPVEVYEDGKRTARADAVYLDLISGHGWLSNATVTVFGGFLGKQLERVTIRAKWLRHSFDGSLRADHATVTSCDFEVPHVQIVTGDLRLAPLSNDVEPGYEISLAKNRVEIHDFPRLPLPAIAFDTDEQLKPQFPSFRIGNSARFGQLFGFRFSRPAKKLGGFVHRLFHGSESKEEDAANPDGTTSKAKKRRKRAYEANYDLDASYLGSRGVLLDIGFTSKDRANRYKFDFRSGIALDRGEDRGYVRVPEEERTSPRLWLRSHGWLVRGNSEYRLAYTDQSDPGVQSEFFESDFAIYEEFENYLQWKRLSGSDYTQVTLKPRVDTFRADVEELPGGTIFRGRKPIGRVAGTTILHSGSFDAAYLRRRAPRRFDLDGDGISDGPITSPFHGTGFFDEDPTDPNGDQQVVRADLVQELEAPLSLPIAGANLVPFVRVRATGWDRAVARTNATRLVAETGARLSTVFWKDAGKGRFHQVSPYVGIRRQFGFEERGTPHVFDTTETQLFGDFVELGMRSRFGVDGGQSRLDLDLRTAYASDRSDGRKDGWLPLETFARFGIAPGGRVFDVWYDGRFDLEESEFVYSLFSLGTRFGDDAGFQIGHTYGRDDSFQKIFDAATLSGFYRWSEKWEIEARQTLSLLANTKLGTGLLLRRYGHDLVFEVETSFREGEGSSFSLSVKPRLGFRPNRIGYIHW